VCLTKLGYAVTDFPDEDIQALDLIDADKNGSISVKELCDFFAVRSSRGHTLLVEDPCSVPCTVQEVYTFSLIDADKNGSISATSSRRGRTLSL
jgi:hypothetical protein